MSNYYNIPQKLSSDVNRISKGWHSKPWSLESIEPSEYTDALVMCFHDEKYSKLRNQRTEHYNSIVTLLQSGRVTTSRLNAAFRRLKEIDDMIGSVILEYLAVYSCEKNGNKELISSNEIDDTDFTNEQKEALKNIRCIQQQIAFKMSSIEDDCLALDSAIGKIMDNTKYSACEGVKTAIKQMRSFIDLNNDTLQTQEELDLHADTSDMISELLSKKVKTYYNKLAKLRNSKNKSKK